MLALCEFAHAGPVAPTEPEQLVAQHDPNDGAGAVLASEILVGDDDAHEWTMSWSDLGIAADGAPGATNPPAVVLPRSLDAEKPPVIAAPLPPAVISGMIGLAAVYAYKRRNRFANR